MIRDVERAAVRRNEVQPRGPVSRMGMPAAGMVVGLLLMLGGGSGAAHALAPSRNVRGNPADEDLAARCTLPGTQTTIRLYRGGAGATVASWYSLTRERPGARELQFWFSYSTPVVTGITCRPGEVVLHGEPGLGDVATLTLAQIERELVPRPLVYWRNGPERVSRDSVRAAGLPEYAKIDLAFALAVLAGGAVLAAFSGQAFARARRE